MQRVGTAAGGARSGGPCRIGCTLCYQRPMRTMTTSTARYSGARSSVRSAGSARPRHSPRRFRRAACPVPPGPGPVDVRRRPGFEFGGSAERIGPAPIQCPRDGQADAFRRCFRLAVADMGVAQRHARLPVAEQARDDRQWDTPQHGVAGKCVTQIMQANILNPGLPAHRDTRAAGWVSMRAPGLAATGTRRGCPSVADAR